MMVWFAVALGGAFGSVARHGVNHLAHVWPLLIAVSAGHLSGQRRRMFDVRHIGEVDRIRPNRTALLRARIRVCRDSRRLYDFLDIWPLDTITLIRGGMAGAAAWNVIAHMSAGLIAT